MQGYTGCVCSSRLPQERIRDCYQVMRVQIHKYARVSKSRRDHVRYVLKHFKH